MMKTFCLSLCLIFSLVISYGQQRTIRPYQIQLNFSGAIYKALGNQLANSEVDDLNVSEWALPGVSIGYHINRKWYAGFSFQPSHGLRLQEAWGFNAEVRDLLITVDHETSAFYNLELKYSPLSIGLYAGLFFTHNPDVPYQMQFSAKGQDFQIGDNRYEGNWEANWNFKKVNTIGFAVGYNKIFASGLSFNLGLAIPLITEPLYQNIRIRPLDSSNQLTEQDHVLAVQSIEKEVFYYPVQLKIGLGLNFMKQLNP